MQQFPELLLVHLFHNLPEPLDDLMVLVVSTFILRIGNPVLQINKRNPIQNHLELICIED